METADFYQGQLVNCLRLTLSAGAHHQNYDFETHLPLGRRLARAYVSITDGCQMGVTLSSLLASNDPHVKLTIVMTHTSAGCKC